MKVDVELVYLHGPHFHASGITGKNMGDRLDVRDPKQRDIVLAYDTEEKELMVTWGGRTAHIPESNVRAYFPYVEGKRPEPKKIISVSNVKAQVSTPQDHVFAGMGAGKSK